MMLQNTVPVTNHASKVSNEKVGVLPCLLETNSISSYI